MFADRGNTSFGSGRSRLSLPNFRTSPWPANDSLSYETSMPSLACHAAPSRHGSRAEDISSLMIPAARSSLIHESLLHQSERSFSGCDTGSRTSEKSHFIPGINSRMLLLSRVPVISAFMQIFQNDVLW